ncbi:MAG: subunit IV of cytochrome c oxidase [Lasallia pustulata]|uniref:Cytochrome c oxidase subunit 4, mitochondrial n=1 Tax=Lasallia pustulata TaxID=136370 RepID=A0A1W5CWP5_9LECA|nr:MAG: subunit IV of cytochrome c oxidase [Lasallia pustulata]SLM35287.1 Cytochrome c oxidase, subunit Vb [Lasallia pustulata]
MFLRRSAVGLSRQAVVKPIAARTFTSSFLLRKPSPGSSTDPHAPKATPQSTAPKPGEPDARVKPFEEIQTEADLLPPGAAPGTVPTDLDQATGLERLEILGKMQGIDIFDMKPLDASRKGTLDNPIVVRSFGDEQYAGCTGVPADSHVTIWLTMSRDRPIERCPECGNVLKMEYLGPPDEAHDEHGHGGHGEHADGAHNYVEPKTFADFVRPEYR